MRESLQIGWPITLMAIIFAAPIAFGAPGSALTQGSKPSFALTISAAKAPLKTGSTVQIDVVVKNISGHDISLEMYYVRPYVEITDRVNISNVNGASISKTDFGNAALEHTGAVNGKVVEIPLKTDKSFAYHLNINDLYDLSRPGQYTIQIERFDEDSKTIVKSNTITVTKAP